MEERVKMFLFGRWLSTCYSTSEMNTSDGYWWKQQLDHFNEIVYPNYQKNGSVEDCRIFLTDLDIVRGVINDLP